MTTYEEVKIWIDQIRQEASTLKLLLADEQKGIETATLIVENSIEVNVGSLNVEGSVQAADTVSVSDISSLVEFFGEQLKTNDLRNQVRGAAGDRGPQGERGGKGTTGSAGD